MAKWSINIDRWTKRTSGNMNAAVRAMSLEIFAKIIVRTPVDTGRARGNWQIGMDFIPQGYDAEKLDKGGQVTSAAASAEIGKYQAGMKISFRNNLPYIVALEHGHSFRQAPFGMVRVTLVEFGAISRRAARKARAGG